MCLIYLNKLIAARAHLTSWATTYTKHHRCCGLGASSDIMNDSQKWCFVPDTLHTFFILASKVTSAISTLEQNITSGFLTMSHSYTNHRYWDSILETFLQHLLLDSPNLIRSSTVPWTAAQTRNWSLAVLANSIIWQLLSIINLNILQRYIRIGMFWIYKQISLDIVLVSNQGEDHLLITNHTQT